MQEAYLARDHLDLDEKLEGAPEAMKMFWKQVHYSAESPVNAARTGMNVAWTLSLPLKAGSFKS